MADVPERRYDPILDRWVIYAPDRAARPGVGPGNRRRQPPEYDADCPFCPGNEAKLAGIVDQRGDGAAWTVRAAPNRYPFLAGAAGRNEVIVETPRHDADFTDLSEDHAAAVVAMWRDRARALAGNHDWVTVFRNRGAAAGASLAHPHSQIAATAEVPVAVAAHEARALDHYRRHGTCLMCEAVSRERDDGTRILAERDGFVAFVPYAAEVPGEIRLAPVRHQSDFAAGPDDLRLDGFAALLRRALTALAAGFGDPDYNLMIAGASHGRRSDPALHWYARIRPRSVAQGGFEFASGIAVNPSSPEDDAARLGKYC